MAVTSFSQSSAQALTPRIFVDSFQLLSPTVLQSASPTSAEATFLQSSSCPSIPIGETVSGSWEVGGAPSITVLVSPESQGSTSNPGPSSSATSRNAPNNGSYLSDSEQVGSSPHPVTESQVSLTTAESAPTSHLSSPLDTGSPTDTPPKSTKISDPVGHPDPESPVKPTSKDPIPPAAGGNAPDPTAAPSSEQTISITETSVTGTVTVAPSGFSIESVTGTQTENGWITSTIDGHPTLLPVVGGFVLFNAPTIPRMQFSFPGFPELPAFNFPCIKAFGVDVGSCDSSPIGGEDNGESDGDNGGSEQDDGSDEHGGGSDDHGGGSDDHGGGSDEHGGGSDEHGGGYDENSEGSDEDGEEDRTASSETTSTRTTTTESITTTEQTSCTESSTVSSCSSLCSTTGTTLSCFSRTCSTTVGCSVTQTDVASTVSACSAQRLKRYSETTTATSPSTSASACSIQPIKYYTEPPKPTSTSGSSSLCSLQPRRYYTEASIATPISSGACSGQPLMHYTEKPEGPTETHTATSPGEPTSTLNDQTNPITTNPPLSPTAGPSGTTVFSPKETQLACGERFVHKVDNPPVPRVIPRQFTDEILGKVRDFCHFDTWEEIGDSMNATILKRPYTQVYRVTGNCLAWFSVARSGIALYRRFVDYIN
ncbi:hypothetical protein FQN54_006408 [Arachnomyces sp. PD_36]|nr:hypothetical protein FQN54_006408 [Arachnomyces sp. PD_36]